MTLTSSSSPDSPWHPVLLQTAHDIQFFSRLPMTSSSSPDCPWHPVLLQTAHDIQFFSRLPMLPMLSVCKVFRPRVFPGSQKAWCLWSWNSDDVIKKCCSINVVKRYKFSMTDIWCYVDYPVPKMINWTKIRDPDLRYEDFFKRCKCHLLVIRQNL